MFTKPCSYVCTCKFHLANDDRWIWWVIGYLLVKYHTQIADFGMARDVGDDNCYVTTGGKIPVRWTSPEVRIYIAMYCRLIVVIIIHTRQYFTRNIQHKVTYGVLDV